MASDRSDIHDSRRSLLISAGCIVCMPSLLSSASAQPALVESDLCGSMDEAATTAIAALNAGQGSSQTYTTFLTSGDARIDGALGILLSDLSGQFGVRPGFAFYDDSLGANAKAFPQAVFPATRGTVLFGKTLLQTALAADPHGDLFVLCTCAHEFGHVVQNESTYGQRLRQGQSTARAVELHADFLAGYFFGTRGSSYTPKHLASLGKAWLAIGDTQFTNPDHHGTPNERLNAIEAGYFVGRSRPEFDIAEICEIGARYLKV